MLGAGRDSNTGIEGVIGVQTLDERTHTLRSALEVLQQKVKHVTDNLYGTSEPIEKTEEAIPPYPFSGQLMELCTRCDSIIDLVRGIESEVDRFKS